MSSSLPEPRPSTYIGLFLTTLSLLQLELFLTRIFSVIMWYHFAFMAISLAMFGLAAGAVIVELMRRRDAHRTLAKTSMLFAVSSAVCFTADLYIPANPDSNLWWMALSFAVISIPFVFAGVVVCVALTRFPLHTGSLYAADLAGSAAGCLLTIPILNNTHAPTAVILNAAIAALAGAAFAWSLRDRWRWIAAGLCVVLLGVVQVNHSAKLIELQWAKGNRNPAGALYERWNALSRILVMPQGDIPFGWGISNAYQPPHRVDQLLLNIDSAAGTVITKFDGKFEPLEHLKHDVTAIAHHLRKPASVLIIGVGGGRDILTSLVFGQERVVGVEINADILKVLTTHFGDYAGHLDKRPGVTLVNDEARSYVARSPERFGIIQASLIDTWAATSAGAYVLTENGLYTKEAWTMFLSHLTSDGILTMSRWHDDARPAESLRLVALAAASLKEMGVPDPRGHIMMVRRQDAESTSVATILVSPSPFSEADINRLTEVSLEMHFVLVLTPHFAELPEFEAITDPGKYADVVRNYPVNIAAPTDDSPFFFHMLRAADLLKGATAFGANLINLRAVRVLAALLGIVVALGAAVTAAPLLLQKRVRQTCSGPLMVYFAAIGLAFMMVEIAQLERLIVFLGHPMYGLTVVLFVLLMASSLGSLCAHRMAASIWLLPVLLALFILISPAVIRQFDSFPTAVRIAVSAVLLFPSGFFMGMPFPIGMKTARYFNDGVPTAWYWGINGAFSVISSVLAIVIAMFWGITATLLVGLCAYVIALLMLRAGQAGRGITAASA